MPRAFGGVLSYNVVMLRTGLEDAVEKAAALSPGVAGALRGAAIWGGLGAGAGALAPEEGQSRLRSALYGGAAGAAYGGVMGGLRGASKAQAQRSYPKEPPPRQSPPPQPPPSGQNHSGTGGAWDWDAWHASIPRGGSTNIHDVAPFLRDVSTKADAKAAFRRAARSKHPDMGGSTQAMQELNDQWEKAQAHPAYAKFAMQYVSGRLEAARLFGVSL